MRIKKIKNRFYNKKLRMFQKENKCKMNEQKKIAILLGRLSIIRIEQLHLYWKRYLQIRSLKKQFFVDDIFNDLFCFHFLFPA